MNYKTKKIKNKNVLVKTILIIIILQLFPTTIFSLPPLPTEFYGNITYYNSTPTIGKVITAYDQNNILCGMYTINKIGKFGLLTCRGDDPYTLVDEGAMTNEEIKFYLDGEEISVIGDHTFTSHLYKEIRLVYPKIICGDNYCDKDFENCAECSTDCGACPTVPDINATINSTGGGGGGGASGGGASGGGASGGGASGGSGASGATGSAVGIDGNLLMNMTLCEEKWICNDWNPCQPNQTQVRTCFDENQCNTTNEIPPTIQECIYKGTCFDGVQNGLEEGIDCGGPCAQCPWETEPDTCFDGIQNCPDNVCEEGIDCGGPCVKKCEKKALVELPLQLKPCKRTINPKDPTFWIFLTILIIAIFADIERAKKKIEKYRSNEDIEDIKRARTIVLTKRNMYNFIIITIFISLMLLGYYYYYSVCQDFSTNVLSILIIIIILAPIIGFIVLWALELNENKRIILIKKFFENHHSTIRTIINLHNKHLVELENEISNDIYQLLNDEEFKEELKEYAELKEAYTQMITLYDEYKVNSKPYKIETELCQNLYDLINSNHFINLTKQYPNVKNVYNKLVILFKQYEEKQKIYEEMVKQSKDYTGKKINKKVEDKKEDIEDETNKTENKEESNK